MLVKCPIRIINKVAVFLLYSLPMRAESVKDLVWKRERNQLKYKIYIYKVQSKSFRTFIKKTNIIIETGGDS